MKDKIKKNINFTNLISKSNCFFFKFYCLTFFLEKMVYSVEEQWQSQRKSELFLALFFPAHGYGRNFITTNSSANTITTTNKCAQQDEYLYYIPERLEEESVQLCNHVLEHVVHNETPLFSLLNVKPSSTMMWILSMMGRLLVPNSFHTEYRIFIPMGASHAVVPDEYANNDYMGA
jgi:hypothetical protein